MLWSMFARVRSQLQSQGFVTYPGLFSRLAGQLADRNHMPFDFVVVDEPQDVSVAQLRFLAALGADQPNRLFFAGDLGQRIFQPPYRPGNSCSHGPTPFSPQAHFSLMHVAQKYRQHSW